MAKVRTQFPVLNWGPGQSFPYLGKTVLAKMNPSQAKRAHIRFYSESFEFFFPEVWSNLDRDDHHNKLHQKLRDEFKAKFISLADKKTRQLSESTGLFPKKLQYRCQKARWGSCSSDGTVTLNWRLVVFKEEIIDYVILHELCHLKHQDHSKNFWGLVKKHMPNYKEVSKELKETGYLADFLLPQSELYPRNPDFI